MKTPYEQLQVIQTFIHSIGTPFQKEMRLIARQAPTGINNRNYTGAGYCAIASYFLYNLLHWFITSHNCTEFTVSMEGINSATFGSFMSRNNSFVYEQIQHFIVLYNQQSGKPILVLDPTYEVDEGIRIFMMQEFEKAYGRPYDSEYRFYVPNPENTRVGMILGDYLRREDLNTFAQHIYEEVYPSGIHTEIRETANK